MQLEAPEESFSDIKAPQDPVMRKALLYSFIAHIAIIAGLIFQTTYYSKPDALDLESAVRVDVLGLPDKYKPEDFQTKPQDVAKPEVKPPEPTPAPPKEEVKQEVPKPKPVEAVKKQPKPEPDTVNLKKNKKKESAAFEKLKAQNALDKIKNAVAKEKRSGKVIKGNAIAPGSNLTGLDRLVHDNYANDLNHHIKQFWALPEWLRNKPLRSVVRVKIDDHGRIISKELVRASGNQSFDENALDTVEQSAPFPAPPDKLVDLVRVDGILIGFPE